MVRKEGENLMANLLTALSNLSKAINNLTEDVKQFYEITEKCRKYKI